MDSFCQTEIRHVGLAALVQQDVSWFEVTVENSSDMRVVHGLGRCFDQPRGGFGVINEFAQLAVKARAADQLHAEVALVLVPAHLEYWDDVRMVEHRDRLGLILEPPKVVFSGQDSRLQHLERHRPVQSDLARPVHHAHPTPAQQVQQLVVAEVADAGAIPDRGAFIRGIWSGGQIAVGVGYSPGCQLGDCRKDFGRLARRTRGPR